MTGREKIELVLRALPEPGTPIPDDVREAIIKLLNFIIDKHWPLPPTKKELWRRYEAAARDALAWRLP